MRCGTGRLEAGAMIYIGVIPRQVGAIAALREDGTIARVERFGDTETLGRAALVIGDFVEALETDEPLAATVSRLDKGNTKFDGARVYGECLGGLMLTKCRVFAIKPADWLYGLALPKRHFTLNHKHALRDAAQEKWQREVLLCEADALWVAEWGRLHGPWSPSMRAK